MLSVEKKTLKYPLKSMFRVSLVDSILFGYLNRSPFAAQLLAHSLNVTHASYFRSLVITGFGAGFAFTQAIHSKPTLMLITENFT